MAMVAKPYIGIEFIFRDNDGKNSKTGIQFPRSVGNTVGALAYADAMRPLIAALSDAAMVGMSVNFGYYEDAVPAIARSDVEDKGVFLFNTSNGQPTSLAIPSVREEILQTNNEDVDVLNTEVLAFIDAMTLGLGSPLIQATNASNGDIVSIKEAYKQNRRSLKGGGVRRKG